MARRENGWKMIRHGHHMASTHTSPWLHLMCMDERQRTARSRVFVVHLRIAQLTSGPEVGMWCNLEPPPILTALLASPSEDTDSSQRRSLGDWCEKGR